MYLVERDFPVLGWRIKRLVEDLKEAKPKGWRELIRDRRDTVQYWTFRLVAILGTASILLSSIQVVLQVRLDSSLINEKVAMMSHPEGILCHPP